MSANPLVNLLTQMGKTGPANKMHRDVAARLLNVDVRQVKAWAQETRESGEPPIVCYRSDSREGGYYLTEDAGEIWTMRDKIRGEIRRRYRSYSGLKRAAEKAAGTQRTLF